MNVAYLSAGILAVLAAAIHGGLGEALIIRKLDGNSFPSTPWGGGAAALRLIRASWHMLTMTFAIFGATLMTCGVRQGGGSCTGAGTVVAVTMSSFAVLAVVLPLVRRRPKMLIQHPAPLLLTLVAVFSWLGTQG